MSQENGYSVGYNMDPCAFVHEAHRIAKSAKRVVVMRWREEQVNVCPTDTPEEIIRTINDSWENLDQVRPKPETSLRLNPGTLETGHRPPMSETLSLLTPKNLDSFKPEGLEEVLDSLETDAINPQHYKSHPSGVECIQITEHMNFNLGNALKYIWRADEKHDDGGIEDLKKAAWYVNRELEKRTRG